MGRPYIRFLKKRLAEEFTIGWDNIFLGFLPQQQVVQKW
jgi:hypothetical protein